MGEQTPTPYPELNNVLRELVESIQSILGSDFVGAHLQGSFAVGDFDVHSDVDFVVVTEDELTHEQVDALQVMHERIYNLETEWAKHLEGSYFPKDVMRHLSQRGKVLWFLDHGSRSLVRDTHCNTAVVRWVVREKGITLAGPPPESLVDPVSADVLRKEIFMTLNEWGQDVFAHPKNYNNRFYQGYIVLNYCRMLHDLHDGTVGSKRTGAAWAKANLDPVWHGLIDRAWSCRPNPAVSVRTPAEPEDFALTLEFVQMIMHESRRYAAANHLA